MADIYADRVKETTATTGTGTINLAGAVTQFQSFISAIGNGNTTSYAIQSGNGSDWETGSGTVTAGSPNTLSRDAVYASSNSGSKINLSGASFVFCAPLANHTVHSIDLDNVFGNTQGRIPYRGATGWTTLSPGTSGQVFTTGGSGANPSWQTPSGGGGGSSGITTPFSFLPTQNFTDFINFAHQGTDSIVSDALTGLLMQSGGDHDLNLIECPAPQTYPYFFTLNLQTIVNDSNLIGSGLIGFSDGTSKSLLLRQSSSYGNAQFFVEQWTDFASPTNTLMAGGSFAIPCAQAEWIKIENDGDLLSFYWSPDGIAPYNLLYHESHSDFVITPTYIVFGVRNETAPTSAVLRSFAGGALVNGETPPTQLSLAGGFVNGNATCVNDDGSVIAGYVSDQLDGSNAQPCTWTDQGAPVILTVGGTLTFPSVMAISRDGSTVVGTALEDDTVYRAVFWHGGDPAVVLPSLPGGINGESAAACSADGSIIVGTAYDSDSNSVAVYWDGVPSAPVIHNLGFLAGGNYSIAAGCSGDGSIIVGTITDTDNNVAAAVWTSGVGATLPLLNPAEPNAGANSCSDDGTKVFGNSNDGGLNRPVRWDSGVITKLDELPGTTGSTSPFGTCAADGSKAVGSGTDAAAHTHGVLWTGNTISILPDPNGIIRHTGSWSSSAMGISTNGSLVVGYHNLLEPDHIQLPVVWTL